MPNGPGGPPPGGVARRFAVDLPALVKALASGELAVGSAVNVSATGVFVTSRLAFPVGTPVRVTLALPVEFGNLRVRRLVARAVVRWVNDARTPRAAQLPPGMGLGFLDLAPTERDELEVLVRDRLAAPEWNPVSGPPPVSGPDDQASLDGAAPGVGEDPHGFRDRRAVAGERGGDQGGGGDPGDPESGASEPAVALPIECGADLPADVPPEDEVRLGGSGEREPVALVLPRDEVGEPADVDERRGVEPSTASRVDRTEQASTTARRPLTRDRSFRLLLADPDLRELLARDRVFHYRADHQIHAAATGEDLVRLASQVRPMMIIFDADWLGTTVAAAVAQIRRSPMLRTTPLIATAARVAEMERRLRGSGVDLVLAKPVDRRRFYEVLRLLGPESGLDIRVAVGSEVLYAAGGVERTGRVVNLSRGGLYLAAQPLHPVGATLAVQLRLPGFTSAIPVTGAVRWVNDGDHVPALPPGMGVQFVGTSPAALKTVATYVALAKDVVRVT
jgi:Tfp pilus assembly protein PilZ